MDRLAFNEQLAETARRAAESNDTEYTLERAVTLPVELIHRCSLAGIAVITHGHPAGGTIAHPAVSHADARHIDELQHKLDQGPLVELRHDDEVISGNVDTDNRWTQWGAEASADYRIRSAMAFRLFTDGRTLAALSLYSEEPDAFTRDDLADGLAMAAHTGITLASTLELDQMHTALLSRRVIGEAIGILRERFTLTSDQAFGVLKRLSSQQNLKLAHIAQQLVDTGDLPTPPP